MTSKLKENTCVNQPSVTQFMSSSGTTYKKRKTPSEGSPTERISPPKKRSQQIKMGDKELSGMEKRISENITMGLKKEMKQMMEDSMIDTMKE